jgi:hypothetical protein
MISSMPKITKEIGELATSSPNYNTPNSTKYDSMDGHPNTIKYIPPHPDL